MKPQTTQSLVSTADLGQQHDSFTSKILLASSGASRCEVFNVWHAAADNVTENGVDREWGTLVTVRGRATVPALCS
jgi:hypothetical protein